MRRDPKEAGQAEDHHRRAVELAQKLVRREPSIPDHRLALAISHRFLSQALMAGSKLPEAQDTRKKAVEILDELREEFPERADFGFELAMTYAMRHPRRFSDERRADALSQTVKAQDIARQLVRTHPTVPQYKALLASTYLNLGRYARRLKKHDEAVANFRRAVELLEGLVEDAAEKPLLRRPLFMARGSLVGALYNEGRFDEARSLVQKWIGQLEESTATASASEPPRNAMRLSLYYDMLSAIHKKAGNEKLSAETAGKAKDVREKYGLPQSQRGGRHLFDWSTRPRRRPRDNNPPPAGDKHAPHPAPPLSPPPGSE